MKRINHPSELVEGRVYRVDMGGDCVQNYEFIDRDFVRTIKAHSTYTPAMLGL